MRNIVFGVSFFMAWSANSVRAPLTLEQLRQQADQICYGRILSIAHQKTCWNSSCTDYTIHSTAELSATSCERGNGSTVTGRYYRKVFSEPMPGDGGHYPLPQIDQIGTMFIQGGNIVHPNGWVPGGGFTSEEAP